jgi:hypothetical protein
MLPEAGRSARYHRGRTHHRRHQQQSERSGEGRRLPAPRMTRALGLRRDRTGDWFGIRGRLFDAVVVAIHRVKVMIAYEPLMQQFGNVIGKVGWPCVLFVQIDGRIQLPGVSALAPG